MRAVDLRDLDGRTRRRQPHRRRSRRSCRPLTRRVQRPVRRGVLDFADAAKLVNERGDAMQAAADEQDGTMAAILGLDDDQVDVACQKTAGSAWIANYNAPGQVVIAGSPDDLDRACATAKELGAKRAMRIPVGGAFHSPLMAPAAIGFARQSTRSSSATPNKPSTATSMPWRTPKPATSPTFSALSSPPRPLAPDPPGARDRRLHDLRRTRSRHRPHRPGQAGGQHRRTGQRVDPADVDGLLETLQGSKTSDAATATVLEGEHLFATERMVVSPGAGIFTPNESCVDGSIIEVGQLLGTVGPAEVRSSFAGEIKGVLAYDGERVTSRQPIAWLRTTAVSYTKLRAHETQCRIAVGGEGG